MLFEFLITVDSRNKVPSNPAIFPEGIRSSKIKAIFTSGQLRWIYSGDKG